MLFSWTVYRYTNDKNVVTKAESTYSFTEVFPRPNRRLAPRFGLGKDAACRNFTARRSRV